MAKQGMARDEHTHTKPKNQMPPVPEIQGRAKCSRKDANPVIAGTSGPDQKVFHTERPVSTAYKELDNDLARDNVENDLPDADLQEL